MSLAIKRNCPFTTRISMTMDPDPYSTIYEEPSSYSEWTPISPRTNTSSPEEPSRTSQRSPSPPKRPRNAKNLSLSVPTGPKSRAAASSAPVSPFRSPRLPGRRPSNLTINIHSLHRHPSTPELYASQIGTPIVASPAPYTSTQHFPLNIDTRLNDPDRPKVRHTDPSVYFEESVEKEKAYPEGPRLIVEPNIWLYAEPDLELAKTYDLVVNVAREVMNPFMVPQPSVDNRISPQSDFDEHSTSPFSPASSSANPSPSLTSSTSSGLSPKMPIKAIPETGPSSYKYDNVEYMHVPWDHNSSLSADLPGIVDHILERSEQGKKVLVHCQCGVSRSATLVIALVMKKMGMGTHEAYAYVKERSPWIGPNMSLIYQLTDYGRLCGYDRASIKSSRQSSAPSTAPLDNSESRRYRDSSPRMLPPHLSRPGVLRTHSQDRPGYSDLEVDRVVDSISSPRFVLSDDENK